MILCTVCTLLYRNTVQHSIDVHWTLNIKYAGLSCCISHMTSRCTHKTSTSFNSTKMEEKENKKIKGENVPSKSYAKQPLTQLFRRKKNTWNLVYMYNDFVHVTFYTFCWVNHLSLFNVWNSFFVIKYSKIYSTLLLFYVSSFHNKTVTNIWCYTTCYAKIRKPLSTNLCIFLFLSL